MNATNVTYSLLKRAFAPTTLARLAEIAQQIEAHERNIAYLQSMAECRKALRQVGCQKIMPKLQSTPEDDARLPRTLSNLQQQIAILNYEREVLKRYGR